MPKFYSLLFLFFVTVEIQSQEMVANGDFEMANFCPSGWSNRPDHFRVPGWKSPNEGTPDYYHPCATEAGVPRNWAGKSYPVSGKAYVGIYLYGKGYKEFVNTTFIDSLDAGSEYIIEFYYKLASYSHLAIDRISYVITDGADTLHRNSFIKSTAIDSMTGKWERAIDTIVARGTEKELYIGNHDREVNSSSISYRKGVQKMLTDRAYYLLDFVSVRNLNPKLEELFVKDSTYILKNVNFAFNDFELNDESLSELQLIVNFMKDNNYKIYVEGHTDEAGTEDYNKQLSEKRAEAVSRFLMQSGIARERIHFSGKGESEPLVSGDKEGKSAENRRVEFSFLPLENN